MMNKSTFNETVKDSILSSLGEDYSVDLSEVTKNNGVKLDSMVIRKHNSHLGVTFYLNEYYNAYANGSENIATVTSSILNSYTDKRVSGKEFDLDFLKDKEAILANVFYRVVNETKNSDLKLYSPWTKFVDGADMIITYAIFVEESNADGIASIVVTNHIMDMYDISLCELVKSAELNTPKLFPATLQNMAELLSNMIGMDNESDFHDYELPLWVLSNSKNLNGASAIKYDRMLLDISKTLNGNFYILPSSIHELICVPDTFTVEPKSLYEMVSSVNLNEVEPTDYLSDVVLYYDSKENQLKPL